MPIPCHPPMIWKWFLPSLDAALCVVVASYKEDQDEGEQESYNGVTGGHPRLEGSVSSLQTLIVHKHTGVHQKLS